MSDEFHRKTQTLEFRRGTAASTGVDVALLCAVRKAELMALAIDPHSFDAELFAALIAAREVRDDVALLGLSHERLAGLYRRYFVGAARPAVSVIKMSSQEHASFVAALRLLLMAHAAAPVDYEDADCLATIIAHACLRPDHLWRDLGLQGRDGVTAMLERYFPALVARNTEGLRWKKFLARELALSQGREPQPAPGCPGCEDFGFCFASAS